MVFARARTQERPGKADQPFAGVGAAAGAVAGGDGHEVGVQGLGDDVAGIELVGVSRG